MRLPFWQLKGNMLILSTCWTGSREKKKKKLESEQFGNLFQEDLSAYLWNEMASVDPKSILMT